MSDPIDRQAAIEAIVNTASEIGLHDNSEVARYGATFRQHEIIDIIEKLPSAQPEQSIAQGRYVDLCEYFKDCSDQGRSILNDRKEFKSWLDRMKWHVMECDKLGRELEKLKSAQPETHDKRTETHACDCVSRQDAIGTVKHMREVCDTDDINDYYEWKIFDIPQYSHVVAWMPLPKPYQAERREDVSNQ